MRRTLLLRARSPAWTVRPGASGGVELLRRDATTSLPATASPPAPVPIPIDWLLGNDASNRHATGQKTSTLEELASDAKGGEMPPVVSACTLSTGAAGTLTASLTTGQTVRVPWKLLEEYGIDRQGVGPCGVDLSHSSMHRVSFRDFARRGSDEWGTAVSRLSQDGIIIVGDCPQRDDNAVVRIAQKLAARPMQTLYGDAWTVESKPAKGPKNNIAYTAEYLDLHNDLAYYESMPGVQLLHCVKFDPQVVGGESFFVNAFSCAEELRRSHPEAFDILCDTPMSFMKDDPHRAVPAKYYYSTPILRTTAPLPDRHGGSPVRRLIKIVWAPAFEAPLPLCLGAQRITDFYHAYRRFAQVLLKERQRKALWFRMRPRDCVVFNQGVWLHGRERFVEPRPGMRRFRGCYVNVDDFRNTVASHGLMPTGGLEPSFNNGSWF